MLRYTRHNDRTTRLELCVRKEINLKGITVPIFDKNYTITKQDSKMEKKEKIIIKDTPISVATDEIVQYLKSKSVSLVTDVRYRYSNERDPQG